MRFDPRISIVWPDIDPEMVKSDYVGLKTSLISHKKLIDEFRPKYEESLKIIQNQVIEIGWKEVKTTMEVTKANPNFVPVVPKEALIPLMGTENY